jgi:predicted nicotinamide N-methyase
MPNPLEKLYDTLCEQYSLSQATYFIGKHRFSFLSVANSYELLDSLSEDYIAHEIMPYWAEIWPASFVLAEYILDDLRPVGQSCLELGAGVGVVSVAAAKAGASVLATDYVVEALPFIEYNALINGTQLRTMRLDWNSFSLDERFDVVFAADVLYERRNLLPILNALDHLLKDDGKALIATPCREIAKNFLVLAQENKFDTRCITKPLLLLGQALQIDIYELSRAP